MITRKDFKLPLYKTGYEVVFVSTVEEAKEVDPEYCYMSMAETSGIGEERNLRMIFRDDASEGIYAHECVHLVSRICMLIGYAPELNNHEPFAYMVEYIFKTVEQAYREHERNIKDEKEKEETNDD